MLLSDREIRALLPLLNFETDEHQRPFRPEEQIQPCSIDLRLDRCFWLPKKPFRQAKIDFRNTAQGEIDIRRFFQRQWFRLGDGITLNPGRMILGRTFEKFTIPNGHAGKLEGRSTFARLGLSIHCTGDFINPGWRGRMPLQIVNHGVVPIILTPYLPICQLLVMRVTTESEKPYGTDEMGHKYMNDEGEPSRYWQDARIHRLQEACGRVRLPERVKGQFIAAIGNRDTPTIDRFLAFINDLPSSEITSGREVLESFAKSDTKRMIWKKRGLQALRMFTLLPASTAIGAFLKQPYETPHAIIWSICGLLMPFGLWAIFFAKEPGQAFTEQDVADYFDGRE